MPTLYDPEILQQCADDLYRQARWIILTTTLKYAAIAFLLAMIAVGILVKVSPEFQPGAPIPVVIVVGCAMVAGIAAGRAKAFDLKLEAQKVLCQRQVELNTRAQSQASAASA